MFNRLSNSDSDLVIQQLLYNESRNVVPPQQLLSMILPDSASQNNRNEEYQYPEFRAGNPNAGRSMIYQESSKNLIQENRQSLDPNMFQDDLNNVYKSNFNFFGLTKKDKPRPKSPIRGIKRVDSQEFEKKDDKRDSK